MSVEEHRYLIIGGAPKAGTTSVFKYLAAHPGVCPASMKEARFFLDADYPVPAAKRFDGRNLEDYGGFFAHCRDEGQKLRVEASPDYLYSQTALRIAELLPGAKMVFMLRDPVEQMVSWYKYARQRGMIAAEMSFEEYVMVQVDRPITAATPPHLRALEQGRYEKYLPAFRQVFGKRCMIVAFEELKANPCAVMGRICEFAELDPTFYDAYRFTVENSSHAVRSVWVGRMYGAVRRRIAYALHDIPGARKLLKAPNLIIKKLLAVNQREAEQVLVPEDLNALIRRETQKNHGL